MNQRSPPGGSALSLFLSLEALEAQEPRAGTQQALTPRLPDSAAAAGLTQRSVSCLSPTPHTYTRAHATYMHVSSSHMQRGGTTETRGGGGARSA